MKISFKKIMVIILCAELLMWYWTIVEVEHSKVEVVYKHKDSPVKKLPELPELPQQDGLPTRQGKAS